MKLAQAFVLALVCVSAVYAGPLEKFEDVSPLKGYAGATFLQRALFKNAQQSNERIVGGSPAQRYQFPYQVSYQMNGQHICGGSILTPEWILTAGHCIVGSTSNTKIIAGMLHQKENHPDVQVSGIVQQIVHPYFTGGVAPNDIALLRLATPLRWTQAVQPISLPQYGQEHSGVTWVSGWGYLSSSNPTTPTTLQQVQMGIMPYEQCRNNLIALIGDYRPLDNTMICVGGIGTGRETVCQGDSGGPLMQNNVLLGVTSWTLTPCGTYAAPSVYTKVSTFIPWIKQYVPI